MRKIIVTFLFFIIASTSQAQKYRIILPLTPPSPPALNNTVKSQIANQNINFNTGSIFSGGGGFGGSGFQQNTGGIQGTAQYTQNNSPGMQISQLYQIPLSTGSSAMGNGGFGQGGGFGQAGVQAIGMNNPFYQMAMQGIMSGVGGSAFQSGGGGNMGGQNMRGGFSGGQFGGNIGGQNMGGVFGQFGGGFNNGDNGL
jgi:hypothetical protein